MAARSPAFVRDFAAASVATVTATTVQAPAKEASHHASTSSSPGGARARNTTKASDVASVARASVRTASMGFVRRVSARTRARPASWLSTRSEGRA